MEKKTISMDWKGFGNISNINLLPRAALRDPGYRYISLSMFGDTTPEHIPKK
jgi:hypothetical protein